MGSNSGEWMLRIEYSGKRAENKLYKTETGARKAARKAMSKYKANCRIFKEVGSVRQLSIFEVPSKY